MYETALHVCGGPEHPLTASQACRLPTLRACWEQSLRMLLVPHACRDNVLLHSASSPYEHPWWMVHWLPRHLSHCVVICQQAGRLQARHPPHGRACCSHMQSLLPTPDQDCCRLILAAHNLPGAAYHHSICQAAGAPATSMPLACSQMCTMHGLAGVHSYPVVDQGNKHARQGAGTPAVHQHKHAGPAGRGCCQHLCQPGREVGHGPPAGRWRLHGQTGGLQQVGPGPAPRSHQ